MLAGHHFALLAAHATDPIAASPQQPGLALLEHPEGLLACGRHAGFTVSLGGPIGTPRARSALWAALLSSRSPLAAYLLEHEVRAALEREPTLHALPFGVEYLVPVRAEPSRALRSAVRQARKKGLTLEPARPSDEPALARLNARYLARSPAGRELRFLNRPALTRAPGVERFALRQRGELFGFVELDAAPADPRAALLNVVRFEPTKVWGVYHWAVFELLERLAARGATELSLGFVPLASATPRPDPARAGAVVRRQLGLVAAARRPLYALEGLEQMKSAWPHRAVPRWVAFRTRNVLGAGVALCAAMGFDAWSLATSRAHGARRWSRA